MYDYDYDSDAFQEWVNSLFGYEVNVRDLDEESYYELEDLFRKENE